MKTLDQICEGVDKIRDTIVSCKTHAQLQSSKRMLLSFRRIYDTGDHEFNEICVQLNSLINSVSTSISIAESRAYLEKSIRHAKIKKNCNPN